MDVEISQSIAVVKRVQFHSKCSIKLYQFQENVGDMQKRQSCLLQHQTELNDKATQFCHRIHVHVYDSSTIQLNLSHGRAKHVTKNVRLKFEMMKVSKSRNKTLSTLKPAFLGT
jgi:stress response protein YsnF